MPKTRMKSAFVELHHNPNKCYNLEIYGKFEDFLFVFAEFVMKKDLNIPHNPHEFWIFKACRISKQYSNTKIYGKWGDNFASRSQSTKEQKILKGKWL